MSRRTKQSSTDLHQRIGNVKLENRLTLRAGLIAHDATGLGMVEWDKAA